MRVTLNFFILFLLVIVHQAMGQSVNPNDTLKLGKGASAADKSIIFDTNNGVSNKKLSVESISKTLKYDGNKFQLGDGSSSSNKELTINGTAKSLKYDGTATEFQLNDDLGITSGNKLKTNSIDATSGTEVSVEQNLRAKGKVKIGTGSHELRVSGDKLEFTNNGTLYKKIGSGSGSGDGGINILTNAGFEDGLTPGWSNTGGTLSLQQYSNTVEGEVNFARLVASASGEYLESTAVASPTFTVGGCLASIDYNSSDVSSWKLQVYDGSSNLLSEQSLPAKNWQKGVVTFPCPVVGLSVKLRVISTAAGTIDIDRAYLGKENRTFQVAQAGHVGRLVYSSAASCVWTTTSASFASYAAVAACSSPTVSGLSVSAPATKIPGLVLNAKPGRYVVVVEGLFQPSSSTVSSNQQYTLSDGSVTDGLAYTDSSGIINASSGKNISANHLEGSFSYSSAQTVTIQIQGRTTSASNAAQVVNTTTVPNLTIDVYYYPTESQTAITPEAGDGWMIAANIGDTNGINLGTAAISSYSEITDTDMDLVLQPTSAPAKIACASGTASTGLTCSSSESVGISFTPPQAGLYRACFHFSNYVNSAGTAYNGFQIIETTDISSAVISEGGERVVNGASGGVNTGHNSIRVCGIFNFASATEKTLRLMREQSTGHSDNRISCDRAASYGQPDIFVEVYPLYNQNQKPILVGDQVTVKGANNPKSCWVTWGTCNTASCTPIVNRGGCLNTVTRNAAGNYSVGFNASFWSEQPSCSYQCSGERCFSGPLPTTSSYQVFSRDSAGAQSDTISNMVICNGI